VKVKVLLFGVLMSESGKQILEIEGVKTILDLKEKLEKKFPIFSEYQYQIFVNHEQAQEGKVLKSHDEIALIPPFAGG